MRIGLQFPASQPAIGGGYTFEWELFRAFRREFAARNEPILICGENGRPPGIDAAEYLTVKHAALTPSPIKALLRRLPGVRLAAAAYRRRAQPVQPATPNNGAAQEWTHALRARHIEFLLHISPFVMCQDVPFAIIVWDLEHRRHPYFPELSDNGELARREQHYSETLLRAAIIVTGTEIGRHELQHYYGVPAERIFVIPHPTPQDALDTAYNAKLPRPDWMPANGPVILYPAQFWAHKNHVGLLAATARLIQKRNIKLTVVLPGSDRGNRTHVERVAERLGLKDSVRFVGFVTRSELLAAYQHSSMLVYASLCGPENLPPLEAFALGCPVVASEFPGSREQLADAALLVKGTDEESMADAMWSLLDRPELRDQLIERGRQRAMTWSPDRFAATMLAHVDEFSHIRRNWT